MKPLIVIEDDPDAWLQMQRMLVRIGYGSQPIWHYSSIGELQQAETDDVAFVLSDLTLPDSPAEKTFDVVCRMFPRAPIIVISGDAEIDTAINTIKKGAQDYLLKGDINEKILSKTIQYAIERKRADNDYQQLFHDSPAPMYIFEKESLRMLAVNKAALQQYGYSREEFLHLKVTDIRPSYMVDSFLLHLDTHRPSFFDAGRWLHKKKDGSEFYVHIHAHDISFKSRDARMIVATNVDGAVRAEQALNKKVKEVEHILESMTDGFCTVNDAGEFKYVNKEFEKILQVSRKDILGRNVWEAFPQAVGRKFQDAYNQAVSERISIFFEEYLPGLGKWLSVKVYPAEKGLAVYFIDISDYKTAQEKLMLEQQNLRAIINNTADIIWSVDRNYQIISANQAFWDYLYRLTGKQKEDIIETDFSREAFALWKGYFDRAFGGETYKTIFEEPAEEGPRYAEISFNPIHDTEGHVTGVSCFSRDITAEREMQKKIIADDLNLKAMIDNTEDLIWSVDKDLRLITANQAYVKAIYLMANEMPVQGQPVLNMEFGENYYHEWRGYYLRGLSGERFVIESEITTPKGTRHTETRFNPIMDGSGAVGVSCFTRDITELKNYWQRIRKQNKGLREIAWMQSHKVRSHVATILGLTNILSYENPPDDINATSLKGIRESAEELDKVIREINDKTNSIGE